MKTVYKNYLYNLSYYIFSVLVPLVTTPYLSRVLGADGLGEYAYAYSVASYFSLFVIMGLKSYGNREIAIKRDNRFDVSETFWNIYSMQIILGIISLILYFCYATYSQFDRIVLIFGITILASIFDISWLFFGVEAFKAVSMRDFATKLTTVFLIFCFVKQSSDVWKYALIYSFGTIISQALLWLSVGKYVDFIPPHWEKIKVHVIPNLIMFIPIVSVHLYKTTDKVMLGSMAEVSEVGFYHNSEKVINVPLAVVTSLNTVMLPHMSFLYSKKQDELATENLKRSLCFSVFCSTGISACIISVSKQFVPLFFGNGFDACVGLFCVLLPCGVIISYTNVICHQYLIPNNMRRAYVCARLMGALANILLNVLLIPRFGALGAAYATLFTELLVFSVQLILANGSRKNIIRLLPVTLIYLFAGFVTIIVFFNRELYLIGSVESVLIKSLACVVLYTVIVAFSHYLFRLRGRNDSLVKKGHASKD